MLDNVEKSDRNTPGVEGVQAALVLLQKSSKSIATGGNSRLSQLLYLWAEKIGPFKPIARKAQEHAVDTMAGDLRQSIIDILMYVQKLTNQFKLRTDALQELTTAYNVVLESGEAVTKDSLDVLEAILLRKVYANIPELNKSDLQQKITQLMDENLLKRRELLLAETEMLLQLSEATVNTLYTVANRAARLFMTLQFRYGHFMELRESMMLLQDSAGTLAEGALLGISSHSMILATLDTAVKVALLATQADSLQVALGDQANQYLRDGRTNAEVLSSLLAQSQELLTQIDGFEKQVSDQGEERHDGNS